MLSVMCTEDFEREVRRRKEAEARLRATEQREQREAGERK
jgi:hypothetical protein